MRDTFDVLPAVHPLIKSLGTSFRLVSGVRSNDVSPVQSWNIPVGKVVRCESGDRSNVVKPVHFCKKLLGSCVR